ncbi:unnamed protein product, partial [Sphacelaria rigidula]
MARCERHVPLLGDDRYRRSRLQQRKTKLADLFPGTKRRDDAELRRQRNCATHMRDTYEDYACHDSDTTKQKEFRRRPSTSRLPCDDDGN